MDFRNTVVVMTSNLGSNLIQDLSSGDEGNDYAAIRAAVMEVVRQQFRPEFVNRIDETVVFHPLAKAQIRNIALIQAQGLMARLVERDLTLAFSDAALDRLADAGFDPVYGARPLKRALTQLVENPLANRILSGDFPPGSTIHVDASESGLSFSAA